MFHCQYCIWVGERYSGAKANYTSSIPACLSFLPFIMSSVDIFHVNKLLSLQNIHLNISCSFFKLFDWSVDELTESYNQTGDVSETICLFLSKFGNDRKKSKVTNQMVSLKYEWINHLSSFIMIFIYFHHNSDLYFILAINNTDFHLLLMVSWFLCINFFK